MKKLELIEESSEDKDPETYEQAEAEKYTSNLFEKMTAWLPQSIRSRKYLGLCFLFPALIVFLVYAFRGVYPFGDNSVLVLDLNAQYVYFYSYLRDIFEEGHSLIYCFTRALSGEFMGTYAYYIASPFAWLTLLFPSDHITEALYLIFVLKSGCCGFTLGWFLDQKGHKNKVTCVAFSVMYALCSYAIVMMHNSMWIDCMILLPLIARGIEKIVTERKYKLFIISLSLAILSNYYIGYMMVLFVVIYFFYFYFSQSQDSLNPQGDIYHFPKTVLRMLLYGLLAVGIAAVIILPAYTSLQFGKSDFSSPDWGFGEKFEWLDFLTKFFFGSYDTVRPAGLPFVYAGMLVTILAPLYFFVPSISTREKVCSAIVVIFMVLSFNTTDLDLIWHGFQYPNWLNYRYAFTFVFFLIVLSAKALEHIKELKFSYIALTCVGLLVLLFILQKQDYDNVKDLETVWVSAAFIIIFLFILRALSLPDFSINRTASFMLAFVVLMEMTCSTVYDLICLDDDVVFSSRKGFVEFMDKLEPIVDDIYESDTSFYRFEKTMHRKTSDNMYLNIRGLTGSTSALNSSVIEFLEKMGMAAHSHWSKYKGSSTFLDSLTGIKYIIAYNTDSISDLYQPVAYYYQDDSPNAMTVYQNPYAFSLAFGVSPMVRELDETDTVLYKSSSNPEEEVSVFQNLLSAYEKTSTLMKYMLGDLSLSDSFYPATIKTTTNSNIKTVSVVNHRGYKTNDTSKEASITYTVDITSTDPLYFYIPTDYPRECTLYVNGIQKATVGGDDSNTFCELGSYKVGETITVKLILKETNLYIRTGGNLFYYFDEEAYLPQLTELATKDQFNITSYSDTEFNGTISIEAGRELVMTSLPYDEGWKVYVDGEEVQIEKVLDTFIAFETTPGEHTLRLVYQPSCLILGGAISVVCVLGFIALCVGEFIITKKKKKGLVSEGPEQKNDSFEDNNDTDSENETSSELSTPSEEVPPDEEEMIDISEEKQS